MTLCLPSMRVRSSQILGRRVECFLYPSRLASLDREYLVLSIFGNFKPAMTELTFVFTAPSSCHLGL